MVFKGSGVAVLAAVLMAACGGGGGDGYGAGPLWMAMDVKLPMSTVMAGSTS